MPEATTRSDFVYAFHIDQYAANIGQSFISSETMPDMVALECAEIGSTRDEVKRAIPRVHQLLNSITDPRSSKETTKAALRSLGPFYGELLKPLVGSAVEIALIDVYEDLDLSTKSAHFSFVEQPWRLTEVVSNDRMSLEDRKEDIFSLAKEGANIYIAREKVVIGQLREYAEKVNHLAVYQGVGHQVVATALSAENWQVNKLFVPSLKAWGDETASDGDYTPIFLKLIEALANENEHTDSVNDLVDKALLTEFVVAHIAKSPKLNSETGNVYGAMIAAKRIVEKLDPERIDQKLKAAVKASRNHTNHAKVIAPLMPKHSLKVLAD